jgi:aspartate aminotransferase/aminotransferase
MLMLAKRVQEVDASGIRKVFDLAQNLKDPVNLSIGQPDFDVADPIKEEAKAWIDRGFNKYTVTQGIAELREKVRQMYLTDGIDPGEVFITSGTSGGILLAIMALVDPGDEVLIPDPYFVMYKHLAKLLGGTPVYVDTYPDFKVTAERIERYITPKTKLLFLNTPANPTGVASTDEELKEIADVIKPFNTMVLFDEIYRVFSYDSKPGNIARYYPNTLILNGLSKLQAMTGWRVGWACGPKEVIQQMIKLQQYTFVCAPSFAQKAALVALDQTPDKQFNDYRKKRDMVYEGLKDKFKVTRPDGAFYIFPEAPGGDGDRFVEKAIKNNLLIIPGSVFSEQATNFRISFAASDETIGKGLEILNSMA